MDATFVKPLLMRLATRQDAPRIAEIHMAAFGTNAMLLAQFPTPAIRQALQISIENKALADIDDPKTTVLVVAVGSDGKTDWMRQDCCYALLCGFDEGCITLPCLIRSLQISPIRRIFTQSTNC
jgi:hypothetical protein